MATSRFKPLISSLLGFSTRIPASVVCRPLSTSSTSKASEQVSGKDYNAERQKTTYTFTTLHVEKPAFGVLQVELSRPDRLNALNKDAWREIRECFRAIAIDPDCRVVILAGLGKHFCSGIDLTDMAELAGMLGSDEDVARKAFRLRQTIRSYQESFTAIEECPKPVIAAIHGGCIGAGVDMTTACDIRYCTDDAFFSIKEVDIGLAADVGTLQRLPKIVGNDSVVRELAFTSRKFLAGEAKDIGLISRMFESREVMMGVALSTAKQIAAKSPVAVQGTKINLNFSRDHSTREGLEFMINWNMSMLQGEDLMKAAMASGDRTGKTVPYFEDV